MNKKDPIYYSVYLQLDQLLSSQKPLSLEYGEEVHDETLFMISHQIFELWFKQILHELQFITSQFKSTIVLDDNLSTINEKLKRIIKIQKGFFLQFNIIETISPIDFLGFRDLLTPASGVQSVQFRAIEIMLGLKMEGRTQFNLNVLNTIDREYLQKCELQPSLFDRMEKWLERMPFCQDDHYDFWDQYKLIVDERLQEAQSSIENHPFLSEQDKINHTKMNEGTKKTFESLFQKDLYDRLQVKKMRRMSQRAMLAALFIMLFREKPLFQQPFIFLQSLMDIDKHLGLWKYQHAQIARRFLGGKFGTGGSRGYEFLHSIAQNSQIYTDLYDLSVFLIPKSCIPKLPQNIERQLEYYMRNI